MSTRVLLLSRQPLRKRPLQDWLGDLAHDVVLVTTQKAIAGAEDVAERAFLGHVLVDDYNSWAAELACDDAARKFGVDLVASTSESDVLRAARLRARLELPGQDVASATAYRDKLVMATYVAEAGMPMPAFAAVDDPLDLREFRERHPGTVVVKPRLGAGAEGVHILYDDADVTSFVEAERPRNTRGQWMVETFVAGDFFHIDGIMRAGSVVHCWPSQYDSGMAEQVRDHAHLTSVMLDPDDPRAAVLRDLAQRVVAALPPAGGALAFHLEAWLRPDGSPVVCEIASRAGGGPIADAYEAAIGVHLAKEGLLGQCGAALTLAAQPAAPRAAMGWIEIAPGHGAFVPPAEPCPVPGVSLAIALPSGAVRAGIEDGVADAASAVVTGRDAGEVRARLDALRTWWDTSVRWEAPS